MKEFLLELLAAVLIAVTPILTLSICTFLKKKSAELSAKFQNSKVAAYLREVTDAICTAVTYVNQTYVDTLKSQNSFKGDAQKTALKKAKDKALEMLSTEAREYIGQTYGDLDQFLTTKIEAEVKDQKNGFGTLKAGLPVEQ